MKRKLMKCSRDQKAPQPGDFLRRQKWRLNKSENDALFGLGCMGKQFATNLFFGAVLEADYFAGSPNLAGRESTAQRHARGRRAR
mgnify:CR=1 FL=1